MEVSDAVTKGYRLPSPDGCPEEIYQLMMQCWTKNPKDRLSFKQIYQRVEELLQTYNTDPRGHIITKVAAVEEEEIYMSSDQITHQ